ncbi:MAG: hypothetical protein JRH03_09075 [Deltaproteobacteria bacterium]|nr:hypothetical protein [Deltaproteobacteria bacterium]
MDSTGINRQFGSVPGGQPAGMHEKIILLGRRYKKSYAEDLLKGADVCLEELPESQMAHLSP